MTEQASAAAASALGKATASQKSIIEQLLEAIPSNQSGESAASSGSSSAPVDSVEISAEAKKLASEGG